MKNQGSPLKKLPVYIFLLPLFFVFHGFVDNYPSVSTGTAFLLFLEYLAITAVLVLVSYLLIRSWHAAILYGFLLLSFHIFFGPLHDALKSMGEEAFFVKYTFLIPLFLLLFLVILFRFRKKKSNAGTLTLYLNLLFLVFILIDVVSFSSKLSARSKAVSGAMQLPACDSCDQPDVFLIVADGYSGSIPLKEVFGFDNSKFENEMRARGFYIVDSSLSNYNYTPFTMASMFSMNYLENLEGRNKSRSDRNICYSHINKNPVLSFFSDQGYRIINHSIFRLDNKLPEMTTSFFKTGGELIRDQTFVSRIDRDLRYHLVTKFRIRSEIERLEYFHLNLNNFLYKKTEDEVSAGSKQPRFVYTHLEMPHYPYYFNSKGEPYPLEKLTEENQFNQEYYIEYLQYCNNLFLQLIDQIQKNSNKPPIILFMSDHAFREFKGDTVDHKYHFMNANMVHLPGKNYQGFYKGISTVNQFRVILNTEFGQKLPLLKDSTSYLTE